MTEYLNQVFATRSEVQRTTGAEMGNSTSLFKDALLTGLVRGTLTEALKVGYEASWDEGETPLCNMVGELFVDGIQPGKIALLLMRKIEALPNSERFMDAWAREPAGCRSLITPMKAPVKHHIFKVEEGHFIAQSLTQQFLETT